HVGRGEVDLLVALLGGCRQADVGIDRPILDHWNPSRRTDEHIFYLHPQLVGENLGELRSEAYRLSVVVQRAERRIVRAYAGQKNARAFYFFERSFRA